MNNKINEKNTNKKKISSQNINKIKYCLGIECTAHTFGVSIVTFEGNILSNLKKTFTTEEGGMIPSKVADHHVEVCDKILIDSLNKAKIRLHQIDLIAFSNAPGLGNTLKIGQFISHFLSLKFKIPLIGVNHCIAHLEIGRLLCGTHNLEISKQHKDKIINGLDSSKLNAVIRNKNLGRIIQNTVHKTQSTENYLQQTAHNKLHTVFSTSAFVSSDPILLYASGANTQIIVYEEKKYRILGETLDIGVGNFLDSFARELGLGFPGGPKIEKLALKGKHFINLPYSVKGMDVNFGGLLTYLKKIINLKKQELENKKLDKKSYNQFQFDLCYSVQEIIFSMLLEVSERALAHCDKNELLLGGGVACNNRFKKMAKLMCSKRNVDCYILKNEFNVDNAAMIAWTGILQYKSAKNKSILKTNINPYERTDDVFVYWRE